MMKDFKMYVMSVLAVLLVTVGVGNMVNAPASTPCDNGTCTIPQETAVVTPTTCDGDCATCPNYGCPENPNYSEAVESVGCESCRKPLRTAGKAVIKAPLKAVGKVRKVGKVFKVFKARPLRRIFGRRRR